MGARRLAGAGAVTVAAALAALAPPAQGRTLGSVERPLGAAEVPCYNSAAYVGYQVTETSARWTVPNRSVLASWSTNVTAAAPGESVSLVVLRPAGTNLSITAVETATLPAVGIATFRPAARIVLEPGDKLGISGTRDATCGWEDGAIPPEVGAAVGTADPGIAAGATVTPSIGPWPPSQLNLAAEVLEATDVRVTAAAGPGNAVAGGLAQLSATISNTGTAPTPVEVTDTVPPGLRVETAVAGGGSCTVSGQQVTCEIASLAPGANVPVVVLVTPAAPGSFVNRVAAASTPEIAPIDNAATATLTVVAPPTDHGRDDGRDRDDDPAPPKPRCVVPTLTRTPLGVARRLLRDLDCTPGTVTRKRSPKVPKGAVIATKPGRGQYAAGSPVRIVVSSGKPPRKPAGRGGRARR
jgi:Domain of unknown function DUF11